MVHSLRKYLSNRGSALFMVISTMTALMVTCMAMYFAVVSSRTAQYAVFDQEQSYQAARSTSDILLGGLKSGVLAAGSNDLLKKMVKMDEGQVITTDGNGFASLNPTATGKDDENLGAYDVTITRLKDENVDGENNYTYEIAVTTSVNGVREVVHNIVHIRPPSSEPVDMDPQVFAATGYTDQDTYVDGGTFLTDMFLDTENVIISAYPRMQNEFTGNLSVGGSLHVNGPMQPNETRPVVWAIRNKLYESPNQNHGLKFFSTDSNRSKVLIGGDLDMGDNWGSISNADIYVNGDFYYGQSNYDNCRLFVHGNVYVRTNGKNLSNFPIYCDGQVIEIEGGSKSGSIMGTWAEEKKLPSGALNRHDAMTALDNATATTTYYKWVINDKYEKKRVYDPNTKKWKTTSEDDPKYVPELDETHHKAVHKTLHWVLGNYDGTTASNITPVPVQTLTYGVDGTGCIIDDTTMYIANGSINDMALIVDTGDDPNNVYTIRVTANRDYNGDGVNETFSWFPENARDGTDRFKLLVKGRGSLVIDIPEGVTYQDMHRSQTAHYNWWVLAGGTTSELAGQKIYSRVEFQDSLEKFVHKDCGGSDDDCSYEEEDSKTECQFCNGKKKMVTCKRHEYSFYYCPNCEKELKDNDFAKKCINRVGRQEIDEYLASHSDIKARMEKDDEGNLIYPTTNIFLVSVEESADIRLSITTNAEQIIMNAFFGYIYAPYMTFKGYGSNSGGGYIRFFGGATVSDFIFQDAMSMVTCWPEKLPEDLMSESCRANKLTGTPKTWKISLGSY